MPLVANSGLPTFARLAEEGHEVLTPERAAHQDIRELHIGLLNMMPDAALEATERQFMRLVGSSNRIAQFHVHPFSVRGLVREGRAAEHVERHYNRFEDVAEQGLDALVITGANPANPDITAEGFWNGMLEVMDWSREHVTSTVCSCLATHGAVKQYFGVERIKLPEKRWGVYSHRAEARPHPLLMHANTRFDAPHSHVYEVTRAQLEGAGIRVLAESEEAGVHLAVSADGIRFVYFQGHPEYDRNSLLKEYKREVGRYLTGVRDDYPPEPEHYFPAEARRTVAAFREQAERARARGGPVPDLPEETLESQVDNTWVDTGKAMFNNWLGIVYQLTHRDRRIPFMDGVDPEDPLGTRRD